MLPMPLAEGLQSSLGQLEAETDRQPGISDILGADLIVHRAQGGIGSNYTDQHMKNLH